MKFSSRFFSAALLAIVALFTTNALQAADNPTGIKHVILVGVDGAGAFFKQADTPNLDKIFADGAVTYTCVTSNPTISAQSWGSMLHGVTPEFHGLTNGIVGQRAYPADSIFPSVFRVIRENMPDAKLASFCNWNPVNIGIIEDGIGVVKGTGNDAAVTDMACKYLEENDPTLLFVHFDEVDGAGHGAGYGGERHLDQIRISDGYIKKIYDAAAKKGILDSTLFIVSADHGGNGRSHGGWTDGEKYIMFAATGPNVVKGEVGEMGVRDISSVILYALGLGDKQPETWTARVPSGLFKGVVAKERPEYKLQYLFQHREHEPTPTPKDGVVSVIGKDRVLAYLPFDGDSKNATDKVETKENGKLYFVDGYFGKGARFEDGFVSIPDYKPGKASFSVAFWFKTGGVNEDPAFVSNKNWNNGRGPGFVLSLRRSDVKFNVGNDKERMDQEYSLPTDYMDGWVYVVLVVNRKANDVKLSYDFSPFFDDDLPEALKDVNFDAFPNLNIGQDGTGEYRAPLDAVLDEFILVEGTLDDSDLTKLKELYKAGKK